jgi:hypothetical protein
MRADGASLQDLLQTFAKLERNQLDFEFSGFDFREIQDVVDDGEERVCGETNQAEIFALVRRELGVQDKLGHSENAVERGADFVAHVGQESAFGGVGGFGGALGVVQQLFIQLSLRDVLSGDDDSANVPLRITPGINGGAYPLLSTIGANPDVFAQMLLLTDQTAAMGFPPFFGEVGD